MRTVSGQQYKQHSEADHYNWSGYEEQVDHGVSGFLKARASLINVCRYTPTTAEWVLLFFYVVECFLSALEAEFYA